MENGPYLVANKVLVEDNTIKSQLVQKGFGEKKEGYLVLDLFESLYLLRKKKISIRENKKNVTGKRLLELGQSQNKKFLPQWAVFEDLRDRGYVVRTGFKFGFHFRVYPKGKRPGEEHSQWVIEVHDQHEKLSMPGLSRMVRMAQTLHTTLLIAIVDAENEVNYYAASRLVP